MKQQLYFLFFIFCGLISAQTPTHFTVKEGLPSNHVYDVVEDKNGFMWFATNRGVAKYDGETFKTYTIKDGLPNNDIWNLERDYKNRLWFITKSKYQSFLENDSIYKYKTNDNRVISPLCYHASNDFHISSANTYTVGKKRLIAKYNLDSLNKNIIKINGKEGIITIINSFKNRIIKLKNNSISIYNINGELLKKVKIKTNRDFSSLPFNDRSKNTTINDYNIAFTPKGLHFIKTDGSLKYYDFLSLIGKEKATTSRYKYLNNKLQVTLDNHLIIFNTNWDVIEHTVLPKEIVFERAFKDTKGNIWLTSRGNGVQLLTNKQLQSTYFLNNKITKKIGNIKNKLYASVERDGLYQLNNNKFSLDKKFDFKGNIIYKITDNAIVSTVNSYISINNKFKNFSFYKYQFGTLNFKDIIKYKNKFLVATSTSIVTVDSLFTPKFLISKEGIIKFVNFKNAIYLGGSDGLHILKNDSIVRPKNQHKILEAKILYIKKAGEYLYIATDGKGVYLYNKDEIIPLKNTTDYFVQKIIKDEDKLWLATQNGVVEVTLNTNDLANSKVTNQFLEADGLLQNNTNDIYLQNDSIYALSDVGIAKIHTKSPLFRIKPKLYFQNSKDTLSFKNDARNNISLSFGAIDFSNQENLNYQYRLLPNQTEWTNTATKTINFSNLRPKLYQLQVKATDQHNNTTSINQYLNVVPKWWQTQWALFVFIALGILGLALFVLTIKKQIKKVEKNKAERDKRVAGLELQALRSQMNPHFVHNSLNAIQYFIQRNEVELSENYLSKFSKLIRLFFEYSREQHITLSQEIDLLNLYLEIEKLRFEDKLNYQIHISDALDIEEQIIPSMLLQPIVENALNHGIFHKKESGTIKVTFKYINKSTMKVSVLDDGIGINKAKEIFKTSSKNYNSNSSEVLKERLELLNKSDNWSVKYTIQDCSEISKKDSGTLVTLIFKQEV